jgi:hypothetical protein
MSVDDMKTEKQIATVTVDGIDGYEDGVEGDDRPQGGRVIQGERLAFSNDFTWVTGGGEKIEKDRELVVIDVARVVQKWIEQTPVETIFLEPGQKFPDIAKMNAAAPPSEWGEGPDGKPRGPWQAQHVVYLLDQETMDRFTYPTGTTGGVICVRELVDKILWMRRFRGTHVYPVVTLADKFMPTRFGGRQGPHFLIKRWVYLGEEQKVLPAPEQSSTVQQLENFAAEQPAEKPVETAAEAPAKVAQPTPAAKKPARTTKRGVVRTDIKTVEEPTSKEIFDDEIGF